jgi:hypothetical protein
VGRKGGVAKRKRGRSKKLNGKKREKGERRNSI